MKVKRIKYRLNEFNEIDEAIEPEIKIENLGFQTVFELINFEKQVRDINGIIYMHSQYENGNFSHLVEIGKGFKVLVYPIK